MSLLKVEALSKSYDSVNSGESLEVLKDVNLEINSGESIAIVGPSGSGKSTILNIIGTLDDTSSGKILFKDKDIAQLSDSEKALFRNESIGFIFQEHHLQPQCTVLENVLLPTMVPGNKHKDSAPARAVELLEKAGLGERKNHRPAQLSGGERQRVALVRSLINKPALLLADEATGSLDQERAREVMALLLEIQKEENLSLILVTHDLNLAAQMDACYKLDNGQLKQVTND